MSYILQRFLLEDLLLVLDSLEEAAHVLRHPLVEYFVLRHFRLLLLGALLLKFLARFTGQILLLQEDRKSTL